MGEFNLNGEIKKEGAKYQAEIVLITPDGKRTKLESGYVFDTEREAIMALHENMDRILLDFRRNGDVDVVAVDGKPIQ